MPKCKACGGTGWAPGPIVTRATDGEGGAKKDFPTVVPCPVCVCSKPPEDNDPPPFIDDKRKAAGERP